MDDTDVTHPRLVIPEPPGAAVWQMGLLHRVIRTGLAEITTLIPTVRTPEHRDHVLGHLDVHLAVLRHHHDGEDSHLWPLLARRAAHEVALLSQMEADHHRIDELAATVRQRATAWGAATHDLSPAAYLLVDALEDFLAVLGAHLDEEERVVVPLLAQHVTAGEWQDFGKAMDAGMPRHALPIMLGALLEVASPTEARDFLADLPLPVRLIWRISGRRQYSSYIRRVRCGPPPTE